MPAGTLRASVSSDVCCFCGHGIEDAEERIRIEARWDEAGIEHQQSWEAHHACLLERLHERVQRQGPFFADQT